MLLIPSSSPPTMPSPTRPSYFRSVSSSSASSSTHINPRKGKPRLYIALYPRSSSYSSSFSSPTACDSYHWCLIVGPQTSGRKDPSTQYHVSHSNGNDSSPFSRKNSTSSTFLYEENDIPGTPLAQKALVRVCIAKVTDLLLLESTLRSLTIPSSTADPSFTCLSWVRTAFLALHNRGCLKSYLKDEDWKDVELCARKYCKRKRQQRRWVTEGLGGPWESELVSTFNFWECREVCA